MDEWLNQIIVGDCLEVMQQIPAGLPELIVTSPPYNLRASSGNGLVNNTNGKWSSNSLTDGYDQHEDRMEHPEYVEWQRACLSEMMRLLPEHGAIYYNHKWRVQNGLVQTRDDIVDGFPVRQIIIWERDGGFNHNRTYHLPTYEVIYLIAKPEFRLNREGRRTADVWHIRQAMDSDHPAPYPLELPRRAIRSCDARVVLDPFCGTGTTAMAALLEGRSYIGIDNSAKYCEHARRRLGAGVGDSERQLSLGWTGAELAESPK